MKALGIAALATLGLTLCGPARAQQDPNLTGAYVGPGQSCTDMFVTRKGQASFKTPRNAFSSALLIKGASVQTPLATCKIARRTSGQNGVTTLDLQCTNMMSSTPVKAYLRHGEDGALVRLTSPEDTSGDRYERCAP
ncbi:hypothetical protein GCM10007036_08100 [Alsobacter metallidurans]|uniref:Uncharacterized protein n=1 Tax=Alsobacter metallidurans TaxID=340221 RepID=A0A917I4U8_9HYPH|nr:hypothetical protein [Alsobacter metallidurans]GGH11208.1 hypothetical protein GCM10007036_08100 [Alsobacter metallidurans]